MPPMVNLFENLFEFIKVNGKQDRKEAHKGGIDCWTLCGQVHAIDDPKAGLKYICGRDYRFNVQFDGQALKVNEASFEKYVFSERVKEQVRRNRQMLGLE